MFIKIQLFKENSNWLIQTAHLMRRSASHFSLVGQECPPPRPSLSCISLRQERRANACAGVLSRESVSELSLRLLRKKEPSQFRFECAQCVCAEGMTSMYKGAPEQQQLVRVDHQDGIAPGPSSSSQQLCISGGRGGDANPLDAAVGKLLDGECVLQVNFSRLQMRIECRGRVYGIN